MLSDLPGAGHPVAVHTAIDVDVFMVRKGAEVTLPADFMGSHYLTDMTDKYAQGGRAALDLPTDDWPFFYMDARMYPSYYVFSLALVLGLSVVLVRQFLPGERWRPSLLPFFFLGSGFMLVETKAITELGLLFGNTWHVIGITIISVLVMAFLANLFVSRSVRPPLSGAYCLLLAIILLGYWVATHGSIEHAGLFSRLGMVVLLTSPLLFSGVAFSSAFRNTDDVGGAMAYNLMGAMLGGLLEYNSMQFGFAFLYLIAFVLYGLAWLTSRRYLRA
jgi:hypothetical protein